MDKKGSIEKDIEDVQSEESEDDEEDVFSGYKKEEIETMAKHQKFAPITLYKNVIKGISKVIHEDAEIIDLEVKNKTFTVIRLNLSDLQHGQKAGIVRLTRDPVLEEVVNKKFIDVGKVDGENNVAVLVGKSIRPNYHLMCADINVLGIKELNSKLEEYDKSLAQMKAEGLTINDLKFRVIAEKKDCISVTKGMLTVDEFNRRHSDNQDDVYLKVAIMKPELMCGKLTYSVDAFKKSKDIAEKQLNYEILNIEREKKQKSSQKIIMSDINTIIFSNNDSKDKLITSLEESLKNTRGLLNTAIDEVNAVKSVTDTKEIEKNYKELSAKRLNLRRIIGTEKRSIEKEQFQDEADKREHELIKYEEDLLKTEEQLEDLDEKIKQIKESGDVIKFTKLSEKKDLLQNKVTVFETTLNQIKKLKDAEVKTVVENIRTNNRERIEKLTEEINSRDRLIKSLKGQEESPITDQRLKLLKEDLKNINDALEFQKLRHDKLCGIVAGESTKKEIRQGFAPPTKGIGKPSVTDETLLAQIKKEREYRPSKGQKQALPKSTQDVIKAQELEERRMRNPNISDIWAEPKSSKPKKKQGANEEETQNLLSLDDIELSDEEMQEALNPTEKKQKK